MDIEEIKRKKMMELINKYLYQKESNINIPNASDVGDEIKNLVAIGDKYLESIKENLDEKAYQRIMNVRMINPEIYVKAAYLLFQMKSTGRLRTTLNDQKMKEFLLSIQPPKKETKIKRK